MKIESFEYVGLREAVIEVSFWDNEKEKVINLCGLVAEVEE